MSGVLETVVGYTGGSSSSVNVSYERMLDHCQALHITYDPSLITYTQLFQEFLSRIDPFAPNCSENHLSNSPDNPDDIPNNHRNGLPNPHDNIYKFRVGVYTTHPNHREQREVIHTELDRFLAASLGINKIYAYIYIYIYNPRYLSLSLSLGVCMS